MQTRTAEATIKGYYYQFDTSILKLLELQSDTDSITVEGIEDIDIITATETTTVQCKYLSKPRFINSVMREPISLMLDHFVNPTTPSNLQYILYAHFENEITGNEPTIDLQKLKEILKYSENNIEKHYEIEKGITDEQLDSFLSQFKLIFGTEFYLQQKQVSDKLKTVFNCSDFEADTYFYNNALRVIIDKSINHDISQRQISRNDFISAIDCRRKLFNQWYINLRSKKEYLKQIEQNLKSTTILNPAKTKIIIIDNHILSANNSKLPFQLLIENLIAKYYKINNSLRDAKPLSIVLDCDSFQLQDYKRQLICNEIVFNDGFEHINFSSSIYNKEPIINTTKNGNKISKTSYLIKLISKDTLINNASTILPPSILINFSNNDMPNIFPDTQLFDFKYLETLKDINQVLNS